MKISNEDNFLLFSFFFKKVDTLPDRPWPARHRLNAHSPDESEVVETLANFYLYLKTQLHHNDRCWRHLAAHHHNCRVLRLFKKNKKKFIKECSYLQVFLEKPSKYFCYKLYFLHNRIVQIRPVNTIWKGTWKLKIESFWQKMIRLYKINERKKNTETNKYLDPNQLDRNQWRMSPTGYAQTISQSFDYARLWEWLNIVVTNRCLLLIAENYFHYSKLKE